jgi:hypothetical protein
MDFLIKNCFRIGKFDSTLFTRKMGKDLFVCQIYIDDIIFGSTNKSFCDEFSKIITGRFQMSMMEILTFFLTFQIKQAKDGTFISQMKYTRDILKKFGMDKTKPIKMPMSTNGHLDLDLTTHQSIKRYISPRLDLYFTFVHLDPISCLVYVCVQDFKPHQRLSFKSGQENHEVSISYT